jgi:pantetheine-phosphate adenylyltransferase
MTQTLHERIALMPGSFDPFTVGHASLVTRGLELFDRIVIAIGINAQKPNEADRAEDRAADIRRLYADQADRVSVIVYTGLTVDIAEEVGAKFLLRGVRSVKDFEYERDIADVNRKLSGIETVLLYSLPDLSAVSSSIVRELRSYGRDVSQFLP